MFNIVVINLPGTSTSYRKCKSILPVNMLGYIVCFLLLLLHIEARSLSKTFQTVVGKCPKSSKSNIECPANLSHRCDTDDDCSRGKICCTFGCTRKCIYPKHGPFIYPPACGRGVCLVSCPFGRVVDIRGCETCRCKPNPRPIQIARPKDKPRPKPCHEGHHGHSKDEHGCCPVGGGCI